MEAVTTTSVPTSSAANWALILWPSLTDFFFGALLLWLFLGGGGKSLLSDGDTGWHIRTGDYILARHVVPHQDIFTFTKPTEPWFAWEWLSDVIFAALHGVWGLKAIAMLAGVLVCCAAAAVFCHMLWSGGNLFISLGVALIANGASSVHFLARPHVFTFFLLAVSLWILARDRRRPDRAVWLLAPITAFWVNLHGGFLALIACLGLTVAGYGLRWLLSRAPRDLYCVKRYAILSAVCGLATFVNPYGWGLHRHILDYLHSSFVMDSVQEFQSPSFRGENMFQFELMLFAGLAVTGMLLAKRRFVEAFLILFWAQASLASVRHVPIFVIVAAPVLAAEASEAWKEWSAGKSAGSVAGILRDLGAEFSSKALRLSIWTPVAILMLGSSMASAKGEASAAAASGETEARIEWSSDFPKQRFPVALVNQYRDLLAPASGTMPRIFTSDQWGDYLTYRFYPRIRVFLDGRSDLFGAALGKQYLHMAQGSYDWEQLIDSYRIDIAMTPAEWPLAQLLKRSPRWRLVKDDGLGILFERRPPVLMESHVSAEGSNSIFRIGRR